MITAAQAVVKCLEKEHVSVVFGYPGAAICPVYDALSLSKVRHILVRQEQNAAHAASGYARITGKPAVCIATSGPGALNLITGIATAYADSIPIVAITGQVSTEMLGRDVFQEADITGAVEPFVKHSYLVKDAQQLPRIIKEAFHIAGTGRPGPVLIDLPVDIQNTTIDFDYPAHVDIRSYKPTVKGHYGQVKRFLSALKECSRPTLCLGGGVFAAGAENAAVALAERCQIPMVTTMMGIGSVPTEHPLYYGMLGMHGQRSANTAANDSDLLILVGARVGDRAVAAPGILEKQTKIVHIDIDPAEIGKNLNVGIPIVGDAKNVLQQVLDKTEQMQHPEWTSLLDGLRPERQYEKKDSFVNPKRLMHLLSECAPEDTVFVADVGQNQIWAANHCTIRKGRFLTSGGMGTMGYSIPAALGAKLADPSKPVVVSCGDGSFQMQMNELGTMCQNGVILKIIVMKNNFLGMVNELQKKNYKGNCVAVQLDGSPDFVKLAAAYGIPARSVHSDQEAEEALQEFLSSPGPYLLECVVDEDEPTL